MLAFFTKCIETNVLKIQQIRNRCKIFKTIISNQRKFKISSSSQGSFSEILTTLKSEENQQICDDFNEIFKILNTFTNPCLLSDCYLQYCKIKKISSSLTPAVHSIIARFGASNTKENIEDLKPTKRDISTFGELRIVPNLVYALEYFEKESLSAGKLSKVLKEILTF
ncbi:hypothetical protein HZS_6076 [Henneguya salminicola]|nr:hypothetical protein HZS_6076 [Henneguya salminicola]